MHSSSGVSRMSPRFGGVFALAAALLGLSAPPQPAATTSGGQASAGDAAAAVIPIRGVIDDIQWRSVERRLAEAERAGAKIIVFEMDTPGGLVTSALEISKLIKTLPERGLRTVAWVNDDALSAGAMISLAAQEILVASTASIGDCAPIMISPTGGLEELGETERAKAESPILQEFRDSAVRNGYDPLLLRAMVTLGTELWWVEHIRSGERRFVDGDEKRRRIDEVAESERVWRLVSTYTHPVDGREIRVEQPVARPNELLTLGADQAIAFGLARSVASNLAGVQSALKLTRAPSVYEINGWEQFAAWLNSPLVRGLLFVIMIIGAYMEFQSPGLILPGVTALVALAIFLAAPYAAGLATTWTIILLAVGLILLAVELLLIPGFGVTGVLGVLLILAAFIGTFVPTEPGAPPFSWPSLQGTWDAIKTGMIVMASSLLIAVVGIVLMTRYLPSVPGANTMFLKPTPPAATLAIQDPAPGVAMPGDIGVVTGALRPGGQARFGQEIVDVTSQGEYVEAGRRVQVIKREGPKIVVRPLSDDNAAASDAAGRESTT